MSYGMRVTNSKGFFSIDSENESIVEQGRGSVPVAPLGGYPVGELAIASLPNSDETTVLVGVKPRTDYYIVSNWDLTVNGASLYGDVGQLIVGGVTPASPLYWDYKIFNYGTSHTNGYGININDNKGAPLFGLGNNSLQIRDIQYISIGNNWTDTTTISHPNIINPYYCIIDYAAKSGSPSGSLFGYLPGDYSVGVKKVSSTSAIFGWSCVFAYFDAVPYENIPSSIAVLIIK